MPEDTGGAEAHADAAEAGGLRSSAPPLLRSAVSAETLAWLDARESPPPSELRERMARALAEVTAETVPGALAEAALSCLQATMAAPGERATAQDLLAADALLTYALEAAAELGAATLREMVQLYGPGRLAALVPDEPGAPTAVSPAQPASPAEATSSAAQTSPVTPPPPAGSTPPEAG